MPTKPPEPLKPLLADKPSRAICILIVAAALALAMFKGLADGPARHIDGLYFYAAAQCIADGRSPYDPDVFAVCWGEAGGPYEAAFIIPPTYLPIALPMAAMDWPTGQRYLDGVSALAAAFLAFILWRIAGVGQRVGVDRYLAAGWTALAASVTGVSGALFVGQPSILVALGLAFAIEGRLNDRPFRLGPGAILGSFKPNLSLITLAGVYLLGPRFRWREKLAAAGVVAASVAALALSSDGLFADLSRSVSIYATSRQSFQEDVDKLYGLKSLLYFLGDRPAAGALCLLLAAGAAGAGWRLAARAQGAPGRMACALASLVLFGGFVFSTKQYDFAIFAPAIALVARGGVGFQTIAALPALVLWRPSLATKLPGMDGLVVMAVDFAIVILAAAFLGALARSMAPAADGAKDAGRGDDPHTAN